PVLEAMHQCGSLEWTRNAAEQEADKAITALKALPESPWRSALEALAHMSVQREF
ncbi:octaprenyl diphosphate synthase, partial [Erwinia sp. MYb416]